MQYLRSNMVRMTGFDMHFRVAKIEEATSVCTGVSKCPLDTCIKMGSNPAYKTNSAIAYRKGNL